MQSIEDEKQKDVQYTQPSHLEYGTGVAGGQVISDNFGEYISDASAASHAQKTQTVREALRMYPQAVMWSLIFSTAIIMEVSLTCGPSCRMRGLTWHS
jgi:hypothetical protein